jgi:hypothetical protein
MKIICNGARTDRCSEASRGDDVVTASVSNAGQRVVLTKDSDLWTGSSGRCVKCRRQTVCAALNIEAVRLEGCGQHVMSMVLGVVLFRMRMDGVRDLKK